MIPLKDQSLLRELCYIDGTWQGALSQATFAITNPADGTEVAHVPDMGVAETQAAIAAADRAFPAWKQKSAKERAALLRRWYELITANAEDLAMILTSEQGKPLAEARGEITYGASFVEWFGEEGKRIYGDTIPGHGADKRLIVIKQPIGVVASITPWNFPIAMITRKCAPALAAGCTVVLKPAESTPLSAFALAELADRAGIPAGVINIVTGNPEIIGPVLTSDPRIRKLSFTGSTRTGTRLMRDCADTLKKVSLELGGNAPFIVFDDADLDEAVAGAIASRFRNSGQTCVSANRFYAQRGIYHEFVARLAQATTALIVGPGLQKGAEQGPLINDAAVQKVERLIADAVDQGARVVTGGKRHQLGGTFFEPTVLADVTSDMACTREEIFGPVASVLPFDSEDEVITMANATPYGLAAYFYSRDISRIWHVAEALESGMIGVNDGVISTEVAPFGGVKASGIGREGSKYGIEEFTEIKYFCFGNIR